MSASKNQDKKPDFENSLERLEQIVSDMEEGELPLEKMMRHFEEGMKLIRFCSHKLDEVEKKIELLLKQDGKTQLAPFRQNAATEDETHETTTGTADR